MGEDVIQRYQNVRRQTETICAPLEIEDFVVQSTADVSPPKWHLAHTAWFFETFLLIPYLKNYSVFNTRFNYLFNSYYQTFNQPYPRNRRGLLSRPTVEEIMRYRQYVDEHMEELLGTLTNPKLKELIELGLNHEQQHQELLLMDIKHNFFEDNHFPVYRPLPASFNYSLSSPNKKLIECVGGMGEIGHKQLEQFSYDNELPRHALFLKPFKLAASLVTNGDYLEFIESGGYSMPGMWLSDGWDSIQKNKWKAPLYWIEQEGKWYSFTLSGLQEIDLLAPVVHVSFYEADAFARWKGKRLPLESEWEWFVEHHHLTPEGNFLEAERFHPMQPLMNEYQQFFGDVWEWTASAYLPYPGYKPLKGALGEYNGKFMNNQFVLRGGCCVTPQSHIRLTYRNYFQPDKRWAFSGIRLAEDI